MGTSVPDLRRKLNLLVTYGCITSVSEIAAQMDRSEKTIWGWADGTTKTAPDQVPMKLFERFRGVFRAALADRVTADRADDLLFAPASHLEAELRRAQAPSIMQLVENEADRSKATLIRTGRSLVETDLDGTEKGDLPRLHLGEPFRIEVAGDFRALNILALQNGASLWGPVQWSVADGVLHLPGLRSGGTLGVMREWNAKGENLFLIMATRAPFPASIAQPEQNRSALEPSLLGVIAAFYQSQPKTARQLYALSVEIS